MPPHGTLSPSVLLRAHGRPVQGARRYRVTQAARRPVPSGRHGLAGSRQTAEPSAAGDPVLGVAGQAGASPTLFKSALPLTVIPHPVPRACGNLFACLVSSGLNL